MNTDNFQRKLTAILSADVAGYSRLMGEDEEATVRTLNKYKEIIFGLIEGHHGRLVDSPGDNVLAEFVSVVDTVKCAVQIQKNLKVSNEALEPNRKMEFRIGINIGDVIQDGDRIYGDGVNVAARIESLADPAGICISRTAYDQVKNKINIEYDYLGEYEVKNIKEPVRVYKVLMESISDDVLQKGKINETFQIVRKPSLQKEKPSIAVLPFLNLSSDPEQEYFVDGLTEEILNSLAQIPNLTVIARTSSFSFRGSDRTIHEIADVLGVENILEGSVRKAGNTLRITTQLIKGNDGAHLWSETYDREVKDIFKIQEDIANNVADRLKLTLEAFHLVGGTESINAYEFYLNAKGERAEGGAYSVKKALESINSAIGFDPKFALAWSFKSHLHGQLCVNESPKCALKEADIATKAAQRAIDLESNIGNAYINLGHIKLIKSEWFEADLNFNKGLELIDGSVSGDDIYIFLFYSAVGNFKKVLELLEEARRNDPIHPDTNAWYSFTYGLLGDRPQAEKEYQNRNKHLPKGYSDWHDHIITLVRIASGDILSPEDIVSTNPIHSKVKKFINSPENGLIELQRIYHSDDNLSSMYLGAISIWVAYFGDPEFAMEVLEKSSGINAGHICFFWSPIMREVRQLPRFKEYVREIGLVDYWKQYGWPDLCHPVGKDDFECN